MHSAEKGAVRTDTWFVFTSNAVSRYFLRLPVVYYPRKSDVRAGAGAPFLLRSISSDFGFDLKSLSDPRAVSNLLLQEAHSRGYAVSNLKLQKLLFLCHAFYLVETGNPLVRGSFEAWQYGPVHREAYDAFKRFGAKPITGDADGFNPVTGLRKAIPSIADRSVQDIVRKVVQFYGDRSPGELVELTHAKNGPWDHVVTTASTRANIGLKITDDVISERFKYLWFGDKPNYKDIEPNEDAPLVA